MKISYSREAWRVAIRDYENFITTKGVESRRAVIMKISYRREARKPLAPWIVTPWHHMCVWQVGRPLAFETESQLASSPVSINYANLITILIYYLRFS